MVKATLVLPNFLTQPTDSVIIQVETGEIDNKVQWGNMGMYSVNSSHYIREYFQDFLHYSFGKNIFIVFKIKYNSFQVVSINNYKLAKVDSAWYVLVVAATGNYISILLCIGEIGNIRFNIHVLACGGIIVWNMLQNWTMNNIWCICNLHYTFFWASRAFNETRLKENILSSLYLHWVLSRSSSLSFSLTCFSSTDSWTVFQGWCLFQ